VLQRHVLPDARLEIVFLPTTTCLTVEKLPHSSHHPEDKTSSVIPAWCVPICQQLASDSEHKATQHAKIYRAEHGGHLDSVDDDDSADQFRVVVLRSTDEGLWQRVLSSLWRHEQAQG